MMRLARRALATLLLSATLAACTGPQGPQGGDGPAGPTGPTGPTGPQSKACGITDNGNGTHTLTCPDGTSVVLKDAPDAGAELPLSAIINGIAATGAEVGKTGLLRVSMGNLVSHDTTVTLSSSDPAIATVPATAVVVAGSQSVEVPYSGLAVGAATVTATLGSATNSVVVRVVPEFRLSVLSGPGRPIQVGSSTPITLSLNVAVPGTTSVNLTSTDPSVVSVPQTIQVPRFAAAVAVPIKALKAGFTTLTAQLNNSSQSLPLTVVTTPSLSAFVVPGRVEAGAFSTMRVDLNAVATDDTPVAITSSNSATVAPPANVVIPAGGYSATVTITGAQVGTTTLTATLGASARSTLTSVVPKAGFQGVTSAPAGTAQVGVPLAVTITLDAVVATDTAITLASSDATVVPCPASATVLAGSTSVSVPLGALKAGYAAITATLGAETRVVEFTIESAVSLVGVSYPARILVGDTALLAFTLDGVSATDTTLALTSSTPATIAVPAHATVPAGSASASIPLKALAAGTTRLSVTLSGTTRYVDVVVQASPRLSSVTYPATVVKGTTSLVTVNLDTAVLADTTVQLASSSATVLPVPATLVVLAGRSTASAPATAGNAAGWADLTATLGTSVRTAIVQVVDQSVLSSVTGVNTLQVGASGTVRANMSAPVPVDTVVTATLASPTVAGLIGATAGTLTALIPAGASSAPFTVAGLAAGSTSLTFTTPGGGSLTQPLVVVTDAKVLAVSRNVAALKPGEYLLISVALDAVVAVDTTLTITSSAAAIAAPATVVVLAGTSGVNFPATAVSAGSATISAKTPNTAAVASAAITVN